MTDKRLIEVAYPLQHTSFGSLYEKNDRHRHISFQYIRPAKRTRGCC